MRYALVMLVVAVLAFSACEADDTPESVPGPDTTQPDVPMPEPNAADPDEDFFDDETYDDYLGIDDEWDGSLDFNEPDVLVVMDGGMFWFEVDGVRNPDVVVQQGDLVRIELRSVEGRHDIVIDELGVASELIDAGESTYVEFIADQVGEFEYYCGFMQHRERGMAGTFIVEG